MNKSQNQNVVSRLFLSHKLHLLALFGLFTDRDFPTLPILRASSPALSVTPGTPGELTRPETPYPFIYLKPEKGTLSDGPQAREFTGMTYNTTT